MKMIYQEIKKYVKNEESSFKLIQNIFDDHEYQKILDWCNSLHFYTGYKKNGIKIDREQIWFDNDLRYFCKVWKDRQERWKPHTYDVFLHNIQEKIKDICNINLDTCLINKYNSGKDSIAAHKDNPISFGEYPNIVIYSLGCERTLQINHDKGNKTFSIKLKPNSLFIMSGASQKYFTHELLKSNDQDVRYSLTFRKYI